ncbi:MAG: hypothetical protein GY862_06250 [Gammaproteobacteria bacterium]|nr:hypothetical protein [Gammaproteobacteria bacterium]
MKKINKLAVAVAAAFSAGSIAPQADAGIQLASNGVGDALIFPAFIGLAENYFTISNRSANYVQGHIRFRGAAWGSEHLEFDVILGPFDVFVFRLADLDGDGQWEIDQSLDPKNFAYTSLTQGCYGAVSIDNCMASNAREPAEGSIPQAHLDYNRNFGYVEFIGEALFDGMSPAHIDALSGNRSLASVGLTPAHRTQTGTGFGTNTWRWSTAGSVDNVSPYPDDQGLSDFPNVVSGTAFIIIPGQSMGLVYNAEALVDFRTASGPGTHRIDNYIRGIHQIADHPHPATVSGASTPALDAAVILHHEDATVPDAQYVYRFNDAAGDSGGVYEHGISFLDSRGPTLADGDDYDLTWEEAAGEYDILYNVPNSIAEVEKAISAQGRKFNSFYFDGYAFDKAESRSNDGRLPDAATIKTWFLALLPTKHHYEAYLPCPEAFDAEKYADCKVNSLVNTGKPVAVEVCNTNSDCGRVERGPLYCGPPMGPIALALDQELSLFDIAFLKRERPGANEYRSGMVTFTPFSFDISKRNRLIPALYYTFEVTSDGKLGHWRSMQR